MLRRIAPKYIHKAVQRLLKQEIQHPFGQSTSYDLVTPSGRRLAPKAVFGLAIEEALGIKVRANDFPGGEHTPCFAAIRNAGYRIESKQQFLDVPPLDPEERSWIEGDRKRVWHLTVERNRSVALRKKSAVRQKYGQLICEQCDFVPAEKYCQDVADACIEVHHVIPLSDLQEGVATKLRDLVCVCANCHRTMHARMRIESKASSD